MNDLTFAATLLSCFVALIFAAYTELSAPASKSPKHTAAGACTSSAQTVRAVNMECTTVALAAHTSR